MLKNKICFMSSDGGHLVEIKEVYRILEKYDSFFVTLKSEHLPKKIEGRKTYFVPKSERNPFLLAVNCLLDFLILLLERPKIIISTGASFCIPAFVYAKLFGMKTIYIETFARIKKPSLTGLIMYKLKPNLFFIQWRHHKRWLPKAIYGGSLF